MLVVDTNILVYAADLSSSVHTPCRAWLERQRKAAGAWYLTWPIIYEFLRVVTHPRVMRRPFAVVAAWDFVASLLASPGLDVLVPSDRHADVAAQTLAQFPDLAGNVMHDAHTAVLMRERGISRICTRDTDFHRFPFLDVIDPLRA